MDPGEVLASGRTADVRALDAERVLKQYREGTPRSTAEREAATARLVADLGVPAPRSHGTVVVDGRPGVVFERVDGPTMLDRLTARPWRVGRYARRLASLHADLRVPTPGGLPAVEERLADALERAPLSPAIRRRAQKALTALPAGDALCHGDFHPGNVLLTADGPVVVDWVDAAVGHPAADVARTVVLLRFGEVPGGVAGLVLRAVRGAFAREYVAATVATGTVTREDVDGWAGVVAAARLAEVDDERTRAFAVARLRD